MEIWVQTLTIFWYITTFSISKQSLVHATHQACRYTHLARRLMQNTVRSQEGEISSSIYALHTVKEKKGLEYHMYIGVSNTGLPFIWLYLSQRNLHVHLICLSLSPPCLSWFCKPIHPNVQERESILLTSWLGSSFWHWH